MTSSELKDAEPAAENNPEIAPETAPAQKAPKRTRRLRLWTRFRFGIQSKILITMLLSSILGVAVIGLIGAMSGRDALRQVESERLIELRESQRRAVQSLFREVTNSLIVYSGGFSINEAAAALSADFDSTGQRDDHPRPTAGARQLLRQRDDQTDQTGHRRLH